VRKSCDGKGQYGEEKFVSFAGKRRKGKENDEPAFSPVAEMFS
jgi:hypothetical protein